MIKNYFFLICCFFIYTYPTTKQNHLTNGWFPNQKKQLLAQLKKLNEKAHKEYDARINKKSIRAAIVPHAGIQYSGTVATAVYQKCDPAIKKIFIIGPDHSGAVQGIALPTFSDLQTPIGAVSVDSAIITSLLSHPSFGINDAIYNSEHSVQIQLPFIKYFFKNATIVPMIIGSISCEQASTIAEELKKYILPDNLVIISSDFVHQGPRFDYQPFKQNVALNTRHLDSLAINLIEQQRCIPFEQFITKTGATICGRSAIKILLELLGKNAFGAVEPRLIAYDTSAKFDDDQSSVSYVGMIFTTEQLNTLPAENRLTNYEKKSLITQARDILNNMHTPNFDATLYNPITSFGLQQQVGVFTTIDKKDGSLRGCIGHMITQDPLYKTVAQTTLAAALNDTRFEPVTQDEVKNLTLKLSILSPSKVISNYQAIRLGKDGVILSAQGKSAVFLPEVATEFKWTLPQMLTQLAEKAGLNENAWKEETTKFETFTTYDIKEI